VNSRVEGNMPIVMIIATELEAEPFIQTMDMKDLEVRPFKVYMGDDAYMIVSGIGKVNAAMATLYASLRFDPFIILNLGAAGGTEDSKKLGSIYNVRKTIEPDRIHLRTHTPYIQYPDSLEGFETGILATQDRAITDIETFKGIAAFADLVDMEGASVVQACKRLRKKCILFKFVSDTPVHAGKSEIIDHIKRFRVPFCDFIVESVLPLIKHP
jgi:adenosylhomocysteine nucleosidase